MNFFWQQFEQECQLPDEQINLAKAALCFAGLEYPDLELGEYLNALDTMAQELQERLPETDYPLKILQSINQYLFGNLGFRGNTADYYDPRNSFLNDVINRRVGIPITLCVIYLEVAQRIDFPMVGIGMPGHFLIRPDFAEAGIYVDPFEQGEILFEQDCQERLQQIYRHPVQIQPHFLATVSKRQILARMLTNLKLIYLNGQQLTKAIAIINLLLLALPSRSQEIRDRGILYYQLNQWQQAAQDLAAYLAMMPEADDADIIRQILSEIS
ncbi:MAG: SirB1 family protein [Cyanophyceae cyanobacterium]